jgi:hypothetical protein
LATTLEKQLLIAESKASFPLTRCARRANFWNFWVARPL